MFARQRAGVGLKGAKPVRSRGPLRPETRGAVCGTMRSMCGADAGCLAMNCQSLGGEGESVDRETVSETRDRDRGNREGASARAREREPTRPVAC